MRERLLHYSAEPVEHLRDVDQCPYPHFKPRGLWVSVEGADDWPSWCKSEQFGLERLHVVYEVVLARNAPILRLSNAANIRAMEQYFRVPDPALRDISLWIDWCSVAARYDGIIIAPYIWECRLDPDTSWYYAWDCASGCIWRKRAIAKFELQ